MWSHVYETMFICYCSFTSNSKVETYWWRLSQLFKWKILNNQLKERSIEKLLLSVVYLQNLFAWTKLLLTNPSSCSPRIQEEDSHHNKMQLNVLIRYRAAPDSTDLYLKSKQSSTAARGNFVNKTVLFVIMMDMWPTMYKEKLAHMYFVLGRFNASQIAKDWWQRSKRLYSTSTPQEHSGRSLLI